MLAHFYHHTPATDVYSLSLHDALPIFHPGLSRRRQGPARRDGPAVRTVLQSAGPGAGSRLQASLPSGDLLHSGLAFKQDRKSTRLNSSHMSISYAVFCLKKKKQKT